MFSGKLEPNSRILIKSYNFDFIRNVHEASGYLIHHKSHLFYSHDPSTLEIHCFITRGESTSTYEAAFLPMHIFDVNMFGMADLCFASLQDSGSYMGQSIHEWTK